MRADLSRTRRAYGAACSMFPVPTPGPDGTSYRLFSGGAPMFFGASPPFPHGRQGAAGCAGCAGCEPGPARKKRGNDGVRKDVGDGGEERRRQPHGVAPRPWSHAGFDPVLSDCLPFTAFCPIRSDPDHPLLCIDTTAPFCRYSSHQQLLATLYC